MTKTGSLDVQAMDIFTAALDQPSDSRLDWAIAQCGADPALTAKVRSLIIADGSGEDGLRTGGAGQDASDDPIPDRAGAYKITDLIGRGGMGAVYRGTRDTGDFEHSAAIKIVKPGVLSEALIARFERERQILASFNHPNIARLLDGGTLDDGSPYIVMELIDGEPISDWAKTQNLSRDDRLWLFNDACAAVRYAHQNLIVHRDITPSNVLVTTRGAVKLIDFGIAKPQDASIFPPDAASSPPSVASLSFTPGFAAPERARGAPSNTLSDVYSLGKLLEDLLDPSTIDADLKAMIEKATAADPASRYKSVDALIDDLQNLREDRPITARNGGMGYQFSKFLKRRRLVLTLGALAFVGLATALAITVAQYNRAEAALVQANARFDQARSLSRTLTFDVYDSFAEITGTLEPRKAMVDLVREYVDALAADPYAPDDVLKDVGVLKSRLGDLYGGVGVANLGDNETALQLFTEANTALEKLLVQTPTDTNAMTELVWVKRSLLNLNKNIVQDLDAADRYNQETMALTQKGAAIGDDNQLQLMRNFWSARTDRLHILQAKEDNEQALSDVTLWLEELDPEMSERLGGADEMIAYLAGQRGDILLNLDRADEAVTSYNQAIAIREEDLASSPDSYYYQVQLLVLYGELSKAHRVLANGPESVEAAQKGLAIAQQQMLDDPEDMGSIESVVFLMQKLARAYLVADNRPEAERVVSEAFDLSKQTAISNPDSDVWTQTHLFTSTAVTEIAIATRNKDLGCEAVQVGLKAYADILAKGGVVPLVKEAGEVDLPRDAATLGC